MEQGCGSDSYNGKNCSTGSVKFDLLNNYVQQGWQCPSCKHIWNPLTQGCLNCNKENVEVKLSGNLKSGFIIEKNPDTTLERN